MDQEQFRKARNYAFLLLKYRMRSRSELSRRLERKKFDREIITYTLDYLSQKNLLDDAVFARSWLESRLGKPFGFRRIRQELLAKGVDKKVIDNQAGIALEGYQEQKVIAGLLEKRLSRSVPADSESRRKDKRRLFAYLVRRGFSPEKVTQELDRLLPETSRYQE